MIKCYYNVIPAQECNYSEFLLYWHICMNIGHNIVSLCSGLTCCQPLTENIYKGLPKSLCFSQFACIMVHSQLPNNGII